MKRILFLTNYPSPYRVRFFDELGKHMDVTVLFADRIEDKKHRNAGWYVASAGSFRTVQLKKLFSVKSNSLCAEVVKWLNREYDHIVICGYSNPTAILAMAWLRMKGIPFWMEVDGGLIREEGSVSLRIKRTLVSMASGWLSTGRATTKYLVHYGAKQQRIYEYPFSSLQESDMPCHGLTPEEKETLRKELGIGSGRMILSIGQFIHRKGYDILLRAAAQLEPGMEIYIVGGVPTEEYKQMCRELGLQNIHFEGFMKKEQLLKYYQAADLFVLPTREDIWGLVINEAMAYSLPVITTDRCVAGLDLVEDGVNGYIVPVEDADALAEKIRTLFERDWTGMGRISREKIRPYTIEGMAKAHMDIFENVTL